MYDYVDKHNVTDEERKRIKDKVDNWTDKEFLDFINDLENTSQKEFNERKKLGHKIDTYGVEFNKPYLLKYEIVGQKKSLNCLRFGNHIISQQLRMSSTFKDQIYDGPQNEIETHCRHWVKDYVVVYSTLHIKGDNPKVRRELRNLYPQLKYILYMIRKNRFFIQSSFGSYMFFKLMGMTPKDREKNNTITVTDIPQMTEEDFDKSFGHTLEDWDNQTQLKILFPNFEQFRFNVINGGLLKQSESYTDLTKVMSLV